MAVCVVRAAIHVTVNIIGRHGFHVAGRAGVDGQYWRHGYTENQQVVDYGFVVNHRRIE
jgi:hypothetical protein